MTTNTDIEDVEQSDSTIPKLEGVPNPSKGKLRKSFELGTPKGSSDEEVRAAIEDSEEDI